MSDDKAASDPSTTSLAYDLMAPRWAKLATLLAGTEAMRDAGGDYLPIHPAETDVAYAERLGCTTLFNLTSLTLKSWVGRPFSDEVTVGDDVPGEVSSALNINKDVDLEGNSIDIFARRWFEEGLAKSFCHVLVDFPRKKEPEDGVVRTMADDRKENLRPYWVLVKPENLIFARAEIVDGAERLVHVRILETEVVADGFAEVTVERIRVLEPGSVAIWKRTEDNKSKDHEGWVLDDSWETDLDFIPLTTFYADRDSFMIGKPPLLDLADLNISHWQSSSDQRAVLTVARFPILACSGGIAADGKLEVGPNTWLYTADPQGRFYYVEHTGRAIEAGRKDMDTLESQMANYGAEFLRQKPGNPTATARALDSAESTSPLQDVTIRFMAAVSTALDFTAKWLGLKEEGGTIKLPTDFGPEQALVADYQALIAARKNQDISRLTYNRELKRRGTLSDEFDPAENAKELEEEAGDLTGSPVTAINIDPDAEE